MNRKIFWESVVFGLVLLMIVPRGWGHPLGNFSLNHYNIIDLQPNVIVCQHVLDFAEIPSYQELARLDTNNDNKVSPDELKSYEQSLSERFLPKYSYMLTEEGKEPVAVSADLLRTKVILSHGQGALTCLQIQMTCAIHNAVLQTEGRKRLVFADSVDVHIRGIREIRVKSSVGVVVQREDIQSKESVTPIPIGDQFFLLTGLNTEVTFQITENRSSSAPQENADIFSLIDPRSVPQFPIEPDANGDYPIVKSPIQPDLQVQEQISMLQPRGVINATGILNAQTTGGSGDAAGITLPQPLQSVSNPDSLHEKSGTKDAEWASLIGTDELSAGIVFFAIFVSIVAGASHALSPGHGKTVVAAYLVGSKGTVWHAVFLGLVVTLTHVSSVLLLGLITLFFSQYIVPAKLYPIIESSSGLLIVIIGLTLFFRRYGAYQRKKVLYSLGITATVAHAHPHEHFDHPHGHDHSHEESHIHPHSHDHDHSHPHLHSHSHEEGLGHEHGPHTHTHDIPADATVKDLLVLGITGGIVPCPAAILVLLGAIALHRILFGMLLIVFFSIGLAGVLISIGVLMVTAKQLLDRFLKGEESFAWLQILSPVLVSLLGLVILIRGLQTGGILSFHL